MKLICENSNSSHINANGVRGDAADTIGQLDTLLPLCTLVTIKAEVHDVLLIKERPRITFGVTADSAVTPTVIVVIPYSANILRAN